MDRAAAQHSARGHVVLGVSTFANVSFIVLFLVSLVGLGVAIDYSLLIVTRWREEREHGRENQDAVLVAMSTAGRAVVLASFLLGGPSGSGVATTVTIGSVAYPMLEKSGYQKDAAGGLLAAGGLGAILSPPVLGAAAFIIAEYLSISYLEVIKMATIPTLLYYFSLFLMVELDARKYGMSQAAFETV